MHLRQIQVSNGLESVMRMGVVFLKHVTNAASTPELRTRIDAMALEMRNTIGDRELAGIPPVRRTRKLFHALGMDPTKNRPASERLLRRVMRGETLPEVNQLVDAVNLVSLTLQCPLGVYDWDRIAPPVLARIGRPDETYESHGGAPQHAGGRLVLVDGEGLFGSPSQDAERVAVGVGTVRALVVAWMPAHVGNEELNEVLQEIVRSAKEFCEALVGEWGIVN